MQTNSLNIGKVIYDLCNGICPCYPVIADKGAEYPFIIYRRDGLVQDNTKDTAVADRIRMEIVLAAKDYDESVRLIQKVKNAIDCRRYYSPDSNICVQKTTITGASERWNNDAYVQSLDFVMEVTS